MAAGADFFVSYTSADEPWAEWIAWQLEAAGHSTVVQAWDFEEGTNFVVRMQEASASSAVTLAVLSPDYFASRYAVEELSAAFAAQRLLPVRVREVDLDGLWRVQIYRDLVGLDEPAAGAQLRAAAARALATNKRIKPDEEPRFPAGGDAHTRSGASDGPAPRFPVPSVVFGLPHRPAFFTGRERELGRLERLFAAGDRALVTQAIAGLGGVGKTQLALHYAHAHLHEYEMHTRLRPPGLRRRDSSSRQHQSRSTKHNDRREGRHFKRSS